MKSSLPGSLIATVNWGSGGAEKMQAIELFLAYVRTLAVQWTCEDSEIAADAERTLEAMAQAAFTDRDIVDALQALEKQQRAKEQRAEAAKRDRPNARDPVRARIKKIMKPAKRAGATFKLFLAGWEAGEKGGLTIQQKGDKFEVCSVDDGSRKPYTQRSLENLWAQAS